jgi:Flp pilus assembly protein TadG
MSNVRRILDQFPRYRPRLRARGAHGQSLAEFAILSSVIFIIVGVGIDFARLYQAWVNLESGVRDAAQYLATSDPDPLSDNYSGTQANQKAQYILGVATGATFSVNANQASCTTANVSTSYSESTAVADGGSSAYPVGIATVTACLPFHSLFAYPMLNADGNWVSLGGDWVLRSQRTYRVLVGR